MKLRLVLAVLAICLAALPPTAHATFSIIACDQDGSCGVAVATNNLAVGSSVIYAKAKVGALVTQYETNPAYGPKGLSLLETGMPPKEVIEALLAGDGDFDGATIASRQVGVVAAGGSSATYTGEEAADSAWAGSRHGKGYSVQGNGLASEQVAIAMEETFLASTGTLAERLMAGLEAGQQAGGQTIGKLSAALLVRTPAGAWQDIDLRVDGSPEPIRDLHHLMDQYYAHQAMIKAERQANQGKTVEAKESLAEALHRSWYWDRIWRRAARMAMKMGDEEEALGYLGVFTAINPVWAKQELKDPIYQSLHGNALFKSWTGNLHKQSIPMAPRASERRQAP